MITVKMTPLISLPHYFLIRSNIAANPKKAALRNNNRRQTIPHSQLHKKKGEPEREGEKKRSSSDVKIVYAPSD